MSAVSKQLSKKQVQVLYKQSVQKRQNELGQLSRPLQQMLIFMDTTISKQLRSFDFLNLCGAQRTTFQIDPNFQLAFKSLSLAEKASFFSKTICYASVEHEEQMRLALTSTQQQQREMKFQVEYKRGFRSWSEASMRVHEYKVMSEDGLKIDLKHYLIRASKNSEKESYVLEAIQKSEPKTVRFSFVREREKDRYLPILISIINRGYFHFINAMIVKLKKEEKQVGSIMPQDERERTLERGKVQSNAGEEQEIEQSRVVTEIMNGGMDLPQPLHSVIDKQNARNKRGQKYKENVFKIMLPFYNLSSLNDFNRFNQIHADGSIRIYSSEVDSQLYKAEWQVRMPLQLVVRGLSDITSYKHWHSEVLHGQFKVNISSENSAIAYHKCREYSKLFKERDFLYLRHVFRLNNTMYIVDKSIENSNYIPFVTILRGDIHYQLISLEQMAACVQVKMQLHIGQGGLMNRAQSKELALRMLKGYTRFQEYIARKEGQNRIQNIFDLEWQVVQTIMPLNRSLNSEIFQGESQSSFADQGEVFYSLAADSDEEDKQPIYEVDPEKENNNNVSVVSELKIQLDQEGLVVLSQKYLKQKFKLNHYQCQRKRIVAKHQDLLLRDIWGRNQEGGFYLKNQRIILAQNNVLKFILSTLKKNFFAGKGIMGISLPVTIFREDSNLQRLCYCLSLAPLYCELASKEKDPVHRLKYILAFGLTNSLFYVDVQKPFNPILGETYQGFIAGCPVYAQQISHHPPISSILMIGRGYRISASLESKLELSLNSGNGINLGWYRIQFADGGEICFQTPPAEFTGLTIGTRKFQMAGKGYYFDRKNTLYSEMNFQDQSGYFSSNKWKKRDQVEGVIHKVTEEFIQKLVKEYPKKVELKKEDVVQKYGEISGRWPFDMYYDDELLYTVNEDLPFELEDEVLPLNSNSTFREDLYYRKINDLSRSQSEKERMEILQRGDKKLRDKYHPTKH